MASRSRAIYIMIRQYVKQFSIQLTLVIALAGASEIEGLKGGGGGGKSQYV